MKFGPAANDFIGFGFIAIDKDDLIVADFVNRVLSKFLSEGDRFGAGALDSKAGFGMIFTLAGDGEAMPPGSLNDFKKTCIVFDIFLVRGNLSAGIVGRDDEEVIGSTGALKNGDELSLVILFFH